MHMGYWYYNRLGSDKVRVAIELVMWASYWTANMRGKCTGNAVVGWARIGVSVIYSTGYIIIGK